MKELREYEQRNQKKRNLQLRQLEAILNTGLPIKVKLSVNLLVIGDQYESMPSDREAKNAALIEMNAPPDIPIDTVTTEYHDEIVKEAQAQLVKVNTLYKQEADNTAKYREDIAGWKKDWDGLCNKNKKLVQKCEELMQLLDDATAPKGKKQIKAIDNRAIVKKVESKPGDEPDPFAKVRKTRFYDGKDVVPKGYPQFPAFKGHSLRKGKWIFVKHPPHEHLAKDEIPRLNIRSIRRVFTPLTIAEVWQVRRYLKSGRTNRWIELRMGMTDASVSTLRTGKSFAKVPPEPIAKPSQKNKVTTVHVGEGVITQNKHKPLFD